MKVCNDFGSKINWVSVLQGWSMLLVVIGHAGLSKVARNPEEPVVSMIEYVVYSFHMPLFMMISGYLFYLTRIVRPMAYSRMLGNKLKRLGIPYLAFTGVALCLKVFFNEHMVRKTTFSFWEFIDAFLYPGSNPLGEMWFIAVLLVIFVFSPILKIGLRKPSFSVVGVGVLLLLHFFPGNITLFCLSLVANYGIWFFIGLLLARYNWAVKLDKGWVLFLSGLVFVFCFIGLHSYGLEEVRFVLTLSGCLFSYAQAFILSRYIPLLFHTFRDYTFQIYLMGIFFQIAFKLVYQHLFYPQFYFLGFVACILLGLYMPVFIAVVVLKKKNCFLNLVIGISVKKEK